MKTYYHYTKGYNVGQIIMKSMICPASSLRANWVKHSDEYAWFTRSGNYQVTALPALPNFPESSIATYMNGEGKEPDMLAIAEHIGGAWRFVFAGKSAQAIKPWLGSYERSKAIKSQLGKTLEKIAIDVGDEIAYWGISKNPVSIRNSCLEQLTPAGWVKRIEFYEEEGEVLVASFDKADAKEIVMNSLKWREKLGMPILG